MTHLQTLSFHFLSLPSRRNHFSIPPPSRERVVLPALKFFKYRGTNKYLDTFLARVDTPCIEQIDITFFNQPTFDVSQIGRFVNRIDGLNSYGRANILTSNNAISVCVRRPGTFTRLAVQVSCQQLDWQLSSMTQICHHFSTFLSCVRELGISGTPPPNGQDDVVNEQWLPLIRSFGGTERLHVAGNLGTDIMRTLKPACGDPPTVLPLLRNLYVEEPRPFYTDSQAAVVSFINSRRVSGCPINVEYIPQMAPPYSTIAEVFSVPGDPLRHLEGAPPAFISNALPIPTHIESLSQQMVDHSSFSPFEFLSVHASLLNDVWSYDPFYFSGDEDSERAL